MFRVIHKYHIQILQKNSKKNSSAVGGLIYHLKQLWTVFWSWTGKYGLTRKGTSAWQMQRSRRVLYAHYAARLRTPCTSCLNVHGALNLYGSWSGRQLLPWGGRLPRPHKHTGFMHIVYGNIYHLWRSGSMAACRLSHGSKKLKGIWFIADSKDARVEPSSLIGPGCWDTWLTH